jgi:hypothetical protein
MRVKHNCKCSGPKRAIISRGNHFARRFPFMPLVGADRRAARSSTNAARPAVAPYHKIDSIANEESLSLHQRHC